MKKTTLLLAMFVVVLLSSVSLIMAYQAGEPRITLLTGKSISRLNLCEYYTKKLTSAKGLMEKYNHTFRYRIYASRFSYFQKKVENYCETAPPSLSETTTPPETPPIPPQPPTPPEMHTVPSQPPSEETLIPVEGMECSQYLGRKACDKELRMYLCGASSANATPEWILMPPLPPGEESKCKEPGLLPKPPQVVTPPSSNHSYNPLTKECYLGAKGECQGDNLVFCADYDGDGHTEWGLIDCSVPCAEHAPDEITPCAWKEFSPGKELMKESDKIQGYRLGLIRGDCTCSCGGYNKKEAPSNNNCNDGKDNDCDGKKDMEDPGCKFPALPNYRFANGIRAKYYGKTKYHLVSHTPYECDPYKDNKCHALDFSFRVVNEGWPYPAERFNVRPYAVEIYIDGELFTVYYDNIHVTRVEYSCLEDAYRLCEKSDFYSNGAHKRDCETEHERQLRLKACEPGEHTITAKIVASPLDSYFDWNTSTRKPLEFLDSDPTDNIATSKYTVAESEGEERGCDFEGSRCYDEFVREECRRDGEQKYVVRTRCQVGYRCKDGKCVPCEGRECRQTPEPPETDCECELGETKCIGDEKYGCVKSDEEAQCPEWKQLDDCSDCSCECGGYDKVESWANNNCKDGKDNDCDGRVDREDKYGYSRKTSCNPRFESSTSVNERIPPKAVPFPQRSNYGREKPISVIARLLEWLRRKR
ncbi:hypothetical protein DRJ48_00990 [Candidatus Woesearchaeota archaeon]|nr:MAG: hypothetical protein DRJ48_00990 [Candidatus Woesearchaeota archaeon]